MRNTQKMSSSITDKLLYLTVASCTCCTKTNTIKYHNENCQYRILTEAINKINELEAEIQSMHEDTADTSI